MKLVVLLILARWVAMLASHLGSETPLTWKHRAAGAVVLMVGVAFVLGFMG